MTHSPAADLVALLAAARTGSPAAWGQLLEYYRPYLEILARVQVGRRLRVKADAHDLVQDTFLQAHRALSQFQGHTADEFAAWLRQVLASRLAKFIRRYLGTQARDVRLERELTAALNNSSDLLGRVLVLPGTSPSEQAARRETSVRVARALDRLDDKYREVLILRHMEGLTFPEVAARIGRSKDSVEKLWARAVRKFRAAYGDEP